MAQALHGSAADGGIGRDHAVHPVALQCGGDHGHLGFVEVGGNLHKHRHAAAMLCGQGLTPLGDGTQQGVQGSVALQSAQVLGVG